MPILSFTDLPSLRTEYRGKCIVFVSGSFDLPHPGHGRFFRGCKARGDILVVAVGRDFEIRRDKGPNRPIWDERMRLEMVELMKPVDYAFLNPLTASTEPLAPIREMLLAVQPDIWAMNHDASHIPFRKALAAELGIELKILNLRRDDLVYAEYSTSRIIEKIRGLPDTAR